ncbi:MAG: hypothetical protein KAR05_02050 [Candidatus Omnitrophica bacterium]|nr:hypothetical protein [Candidatus Omnitrophota bacterium]
MIKENKENKKRLIIIMVIYCIGLIHWFLFIRYGNPSFNALDWPCIHQWLDVIRQAFLQKKVPFHASYFLQEYENQKFLWGNRYFATPYIISTPQVLLLLFMDVGAFMTCQVLFMFSIAFWGCLQWGRKLNFWLWIQNTFISIHATNFQRTVILKT